MAVSCPLRGQEARAGTEVRLLPARRAGSQWDKGSGCFLRTRWSRDRLFPVPYGDRKPVQGQGEAVTSPKGW